MKPKASQSSGSSLPGFTAALKGARFVTAVETNEGRRLDEAMVKQMTGGGDTITCRFLHGEFFSYTPHLKVWLATNHKPTIRGTDDAIWNRIHLIPFDVTIPPEEQDPQLADKLQAELPGVLNWALRGCLDRQAGGLAAPEKVRAATGQYRSDSDLVASFIDDRCETGPACWSEVTPLYEAFREWCNGTGEKPISQTAFGRRLDGVGYEKVPTARPVRRAGIQLR